MTGVIIFIVISLFCGFCGFVDSVAQPARAYRQARVSKPLWVMINLLGMLSVVGGIVTFLLYSYGGPRRKLVRAGGYNRPSREMYARKVAGYVDDEMQLRHGMQARTPAKCTSCQNGKVACMCQDGWIKSPATNLPEQHIACGATGWLPCPACSGTTQRA